MLLTLLSEYAIPTLYLVFVLKAASREFSETFLKCSKGLRRFYFEEKLTLLTWMFTDHKFMLGKEI